MSSDSLNHLFATYRRLGDCLKIAGRAVDTENLRMLEGTEFVGQPKIQAASWIQETRKTVDDLSVVGLWALFERYVIEYTQERAVPLGDTEPVDFGERLHKKVEGEIERWRADEILDLFKGVIKPDQIGIAKQIKEYRDWVAHRNPKRLPSAQTEPKSAYNILFTIVDALERT